MRTVFISDGTEEKQAFARTANLCIAAHEDDIEFMAYAPVAECYGRNDRRNRSTFISTTLRISTERT